MRVEDFLKRLADSQIKVWLDGDKLRLKGPKEMLTAAMQNEIKVHKAAIIEYLESQANVSALELSYAQQSLWSIYQLAPENVAYNVACAIKLNSSADVSALRLAYAGLQERHEILRTRFKTTYEGPRQILNGHPMSQLDVIDRHAAGSINCDEVIQKIIDRPFDLSAMSVSRLTLLKDGSEGDILIFVFSHIAVDFWSMEILLDEFAALYQAACESSELTMPVIQERYGDFVDEEKIYLGSEQAQLDKDYWCGQLQGQLPVLAFGYHPYKTRGRKMRGTSLRIPWSPQRFSEIKQAAKTYGVSPYAYLFSIYFLLLSRYANAKEFVIGMPTTARAQYGKDNIVGHFINTLPIRLKLDGNENFDSWLKRCHQQILDALTHQAYPFALMVQDIVLSRSADHSPVFQVMFNWNQARVGTQRKGIESLGNIFLATSNGITGASHDLTLTVSDIGNECSCIWSFSDDLFDADFINQLSASYDYLIDQLLQNATGKLMSLSLWRQDQQILRNLPCMNAFTQAPQLLHEWIRQQAQKTPNYIAIIDAEQRITYAQLDSLSDLLAEALRVKIMIPENAIIAVLMDRNAELVITLLAILKSGAAYLPLDTRYPIGRVNTILNNAAADLLIYDVVNSALAEQVSIPQQAYAQLVAATEDITPSAIFIQPASSRQLAHIIYTSGSTGVPKGVAIEHRNTTLLLQWALQHFSQEDLQGVLASSSVCFDLSIFEMFLPLVTGGKTIIIENALQLSAFKAADEITLINTVPSVMEVMLVQNCIPKSVKVINLAGEALLRPLADRVYRLPQVEKLYNLYGPSEDTIYSTVSLVSRNPDQRVMIGRAVAGGYHYILDEFGNPVPPGVAGELYLAGAGVTRGYLNNPALTAERYLPDPFATEAGQRMYRTGDCARMQPSGEVEYLSRFDHQIKLRGFRIELSEIEAVLSASTQIAESAVKLQKDETKGDFLVAYIVPGKGSIFSATDYKTLLHHKLPYYMVPEFYVEMSELPKTTSGKIDKRALHDYKLEAQDMCQQGLPLKSGIGELVAEIWKGVLNISAFSSQDDFFSLGGHSLLAAVTVSRVNQALELSLPPNSLFDKPVFTDFIAYVTTQRHAEYEDEIPLAMSDPKAKGAVSFAQRGIWFETQRGDASQKSIGLSYNTGIALQINGGLDIARLAHSLSVLSNRQSGLRTIFKSDQHHLQARQCETIPFDIKLRKVPLSDCMAQAQAYIQEPVSLTEGPLFGVRILQHDERQYTLLVKIHHIISDGLSLRLIANELMQIYVDGNDEALTALDVCYEDFAYHQMQSLYSPIAMAQLASWRDSLKGVPAVLELPLDYNRPVARSYQGNVIDFTIAKPLADKLHVIARRYAVTPFMLYYTAFAVLLSRYTGQNDFILGTPYSQRHRQSLQNLVGMFVNLLPVRVQLSSQERFSNLLGKQRKNLLAAFTRGGIPFERIIDELKIERDSRITPLVQVTFAYEHLDNTRSDIGDGYWELKNIPEHAAKFDLSMQMLETIDSLSGNIVFSIDIYKRERIVQLRNHWLNLLGAIAAQPECTLGALNILSDDEYAALTQPAPCAVQPSIIQNVEQIFAQQVARYPDNCALQTEQQGNLTYQELNRQAAYLATQLQQRGVRHGGRVGICMPMQPAAIVAMLAAWKLGAAYIPLDRSFPKERILYICADAQLDILLCDENEFVDDINATVVCENLHTLLVQPLAETRSLTPVSNIDIAYIVYTSGSTGRPKGVAVSHRALMSLIDWHQKTYAVRSDTRASQLAGFAFDAAIWEIWPYLCAGATLCIADKAIRMDTEKLITWLSTQAIECCFMSTPLAETILKHPLCKQLRLRYLLTGGDRLLFNQCDDLPFKLINHYGPTENTVVATAGIVHSNKQPPDIGRAIDNTQTYILDKDLNPVPEAVVGEMYLAGEGLAYGYFNQPRLTAERFVPNPFTSIPGQRLYRTGDLARYYEQQIEFIGRADQQIKLRGFRIELGEIQACMEAVTGVQAALAVLRHSAEGDAYLAAYIIAAPPINHALLLPQIKNGLKAHLPDYMLPQGYHFLAEFPLTPNGKLDHQALPEPELLDSDRDVTYVAPRNEREARMVDLWENLIHRSPIGIKDDFFKIGGHSLLAMQLTVKIQEVFSVECSITTLFENATVEKLLAALPLSDGASLDALPQLRADPAARFQPFPLTDIQQTYLIGRSGVYDLSDIATQIYSEVDVDDVDIERYNSAWRAMIARHEMLRMVITPDHQQRILQETPPYSVQYNDLSHLSDQEAEQRLLEIRVSMSQQRKSGYEWPLFDNRISKLPNDKYRLHSLMDALIADGWSNEILTDDFMHYYLGIGERLKPIDVSYRDYVLTEEKIKQGIWYEKSRAYWLARLDTLPGPPELPIKTQATRHAHGRFKRRRQRLSQAQWRQLKLRAGDLGVTPSILLLSAYAAVIGAWSKKPHFTLNLTLFNRLPLHPEINRVVGDFTSLVLLEISGRHADFGEFAKSVQQQLWQDLEHKYFSGVEFLRERARRAQDNHKAVMPVVFTSAIGNGGDRDEPSAIYEFANEIDLQQLNLEGFGVSQTSQVWLDHAITEHNGELELNWESVDELFEEGVLDHMFSTYCRLLLDIAQQNSGWQDIRFAQLPAEQAQIRQQRNATERTWPSLLLQQLIEQQLPIHADAEAIITAQRVITYRQLWSASSYLAVRLREQGVKANDRVAVIMHKGWEQIIACVAILRSGAAYLPVDHALPLARQQQLLEQAQVRLALVQQDFDIAVSGERIITFQVDEQVLDRNEDQILPVVQAGTDLAYVIFTSGSTGVPKGVMIDHRGALNTILDINEKFNINAHDRVLALSSLSFDLSVYDIFGILGAGGAIVIPDREQLRDPAAWRQLMDVYKVTVFNSVPALMQLLIDHLAERQLRLQQNLRLVMMSGDWIPVNLPQRIREAKAGQVIDIISLGGATEASIWSIYYPIESVAPHWKSIPYGRSLANQSFHILRSDLTPCPDWVPGDLYIGGVGLAQGYWNDPQKTQNSFITHPFSGERLYRTGDLGRYRCDGDIEFLGREDTQVKIQGYRVELEEIESVLLKHPAVKQAVAMTHSDMHDGVHLSAYIVSKTETSQAIDENLAEKLTLKISKPAIIQPSALADKVALPYPEKVYACQTVLPTLEKISLTAIGQWLGCLAQYKVEEAVLPKYYYPSAGSLNPVQAYLLLHHAIDEQLGVGAYYYHPSEHALYPVVCDHFSAMPGNSSALFSLLLVGEMQAIEPLYHEYAEDFCYLEAGYMCGLLGGHGCAYGLQSKTVYADLQGWHHALRLKSSQHCLHYSDWMALPDNATPNPVAPLPAVPLLARQSFRSFEGQTERLFELERYLQVLLTTPISSKERFTLLVYLKDAHTPLRKGFYRYCLEQGSLEFLADVDVHAHYYSGLNIDIYNAADFCLYFLCTDEQNRKDALHTIGSMGQWLMMQTMECGIGLCPIGSMDFSMLNMALGLPQNVLLLHSFAGGAVSTAQLARWQELDEAGAHWDIEKELRAYLHAQLPAYMVPSRIINLVALPLSANGKVARDQLPKPEAQAITVRNYQAPRTPIEIKLCELWQEILDVEQVGVNNSFFELGGNSMMLIQAHARMQAFFERDIAIVDLFNYPDIKSLAEHLSGGDRKENNIVRTQQQGSKQREALQRLRKPQRV